MKTIGTVASIRDLKTKEGKPFYSVRLAEKNGEGQYEETTWWDVTFFPGKVKENKVDVEFSAITVGDLISVSGVATAESFKGKEGDEKVGLKLKTTWIEIIAKKGTGKSAGGAKKDSDIPF